ncbi:MAG: type IVB secretion system protein IcmV [Gammaproteobacteria bacterium]|jgi:intracellular multiplication protein IcmV
MAKKDKSETPAAPVQKKRGFFGRLFNVKSWISYEQISSFARSIKEVFNILTRKKVSKQTETFEEAVSRLKLSEKDITEKTKQFLSMAKLYFFSSLALFVYALYLLFSFHILATIVSLVLTLFLFVNAWREHFWYMQMTKRKLGCSIGDWKQFVSSTILKRTK